MDSVGKKVLTYLALAAVAAILLAGLNVWQKKLDLARLEAEGKLATALKLAEETRDSLAVIRKVSDSTSRLARASGREAAAAKADADKSKQRADSLAEELAVRPVDSTTAMMWREAYVERTKEAAGLRITVEAVENQLRLTGEDRDRAYRMLARQDSAMTELGAAYRKVLVAQECYWGPVKCPSRGVVAAVTGLVVLFAPR